MGKKEYRYHFQMQDWKNWPQKNKQTASSLDSMLSIKSCDIIQKKSS